MQDLCLSGLIFLVLLMVMRRFYQNTLSVREGVIKNIGETRTKGKFNVTYFDVHQEGRQDFYAALDGPMSLFGLKEGQKIRVWPSSISMTRTISALEHKADEHVVPSLIVRRYAYIVKYKIME